MTPAERIRGNVEAVRARIRKAAERAGRDPAAVRLLAITKSAGPEALAHLAAAGVREIGENRVQEAERKAGAASAAGLSLHLVGRLQRNKARRAARLFDSFHALDSIRIAEALDVSLGEADRSLPVFVEVNVSGEASKGGVPPAEISSLLGALARFGRLRPAGLMTMAPYAEDPEAARPVFSALRRLSESLAGRPPFEGGRPLLSMGMSGDFEAAILEGADVVRIGSALFAGATDLPAPQ